MAELFLVVAMSVGIMEIQSVSVDPDMEYMMMDDFPLQAETDDIFLYSSMNHNPLVIMINKLVLRVKLAFLQKIKL